jgi:hypothetical protein
MLAEVIDSLIDSASLVAITRSGIRRSDLALYIDSGRAGVSRTLAPRSRPMLLHRAARANSSCTAAAL